MDTKGDSIRRSAAPVFVPGSPRSGTTLLYNMLLSAGGFAVYLTESNAFNPLAPHFAEHGRRGGRQLGPDYMEVHFEDLVAAPRETLKTVVSPPSPGSSR